jgi:hypothetical protein
VSKVSAIVQHGTYQVSGQMPVSRISQDGDGLKSSTTYESYSATQQSNLARNLMPPRKPDREYSNFIGLAVFPIILTVLVIFVGIAAILPAIQLSPVERVGYGLGSILYIALIVKLVKWLIKIDKPFKAEYEVEVAKWEFSISKWNQLYYCLRDDCVFIPGEGVSYKTTNLYEAIQWRPSKRQRFWPRYFAGS